MPLTKEQQNQIEQNRLKALELLKVKHLQRYKEFKAKKRQESSTRHINSGSSSAATDAATVAAAAAADNTPTKHPNSDWIASNLRHKKNFFKFITITTKSVNLL